MSSDYSPQFLLLGCGRTLSRVGSILGHSSVFCTTGSTESAAHLTREGFVAERCEIQDAASLKRILVRYPSITTIMDSVPPLDNSPKGPQSVTEALSNRDIHVIYLSTTGVYGEKAGAHVSEASALKATDPRSVARILCERWYQERTAATIVRISGIYTGDDNVTHALSAGTYRIITGTDRWTNRIHIEDLARGLATIAIANPKREFPSIINASDCQPLKVLELLALCERYIQFPAPKEISEDAAHFTMRNNQRVSNELFVHHALPTMRYPTFKVFLEETFSR